MKHCFAFILSLICAAPLAAHPHIFVDTGLDLRIDESGHLSEVTITWAYDDFYSLLIIEDRGLDPDFDGVLTKAEQADLQGFDTQWTPGFNGDLVITQGTTTLTLSGPLEATASYKDGRITTTHLRKVLAVQETNEPIELRAYDPSYYTAYDISLSVRIEGPAACNQRVEVPDVAARLNEVSEQLMQMDTEEMSDDAQMPDVGILLASTVVVTCDMS